MKLRNTARLSLVIAVLVSVLGCGSGPQPLDQDWIKKSSERAVQAREMFMKSHGNYDSLSAEDKEKLIKAYDGQEAAVKGAWSAMSHPPSGTPMAPQGKQ